MWAGGMVVKVNVEDGRRWRCAGEAEGMVVEVNVEAGGWLRWVSEAEGIGYGKVGEIHTYQVIGNCSDVLLTLSLCTHPHAHTLKIFNSLLDSTSPGNDNIFGV